METDLMCRPFELCKLPKGFPADFPVRKVLDIVEDGVIGHRAFYYVIVMRIPQPAGHDENPTILLTSLGIALFSSYRQVYKDIHLNSPHH